MRWWKGVALALVATGARVAAAVDGRLRSQAIADGWHLEELVSRDQCPKEAQVGNHLLLQYTIKEANEGHHIYGTPEDEVFHMILGQEEIAEGFQWGLEGMCEGSIRRITVPPSVGYVGPSFGPPISGSQDLDFSRIVLDFYVTLRNVTSEEDYSIFSAINRGNYSEVLDMIDERKGINAVDNWGASPLMLAVTSEVEVVVAGLLNSWSPRVDVNARKPTGYNALFYAAAKKNSSILKALLRRGADPNIHITSGESKGYTPLHFAVRLEYYRNAALLVEFGANPLATAADGTRPLDLIKGFTKGSHAKFFKLLTEAATRYTHTGGDEF